MSKTASRFQQNRCRHGVPYRRRQQGFSLIEFLVASIISMIVLMAAGSVYFTTQQLNRVAGARLDAQQDLRNAANLIVRDARQAGTFGCANLSANNVAASSPYALEHPLGIRAAEADDRPNNFGLHVMTGDNFVKRAGVANFNPVGSALIFVYGDGYAAVRNITPQNALAASGTVNATAMQLDVNGNDAVGQVLALAGNQPAPLVLASCNRIQVLQQGAGYTRAASGINLAPAITVSTDHNAHPNAFRPGQMGISKLVGSAYMVGIVGAAGAAPGLYRFSLGPDGNWVGPQLLVGNIANNNGMAIQLGYVQTNNCTDGASDPKETFQFRNAPASAPVSIANYGKLPALVRIRLNVDNTNARVADIGRVQEYVIDAAVRGGNVCANRS